MDNTRFVGEILPDTKLSGGGAEANQKVAGSIPVISTKQICNVIPL
jgi:hypothetical protein